MIRWTKWVVMFDTGVFELSDWREQVATIGYVV